MRHLSSINIDAASFPRRDIYPFKLPVLQLTTSVPLTTSITLFAGENGSGKSTLLRAVALNARIHIWSEPERTRYQLNPDEDGLYLLDEPENALTPRNQLRLLTVLSAAARSGAAQFIIATHSPILLACPDAVIYSFDRGPIAPIAYEDTEYYTLYRDFMNDRERFLDEI